MLLVQLTPILQSTIPVTNWEKLDSYHLGAGMVGHSLLPKVSYICKPFEGQRPMELAGWAGWYCGHDSAQAEVNNQSSAQQLQWCWCSGSRLSEPQAGLASDRRAWQATCPPSLPPLLPLRDRDAWPSFSHCTLGLTSSPTTTAIVAALPHRFQPLCELGCGQESPQTLGKAT